MSDKQEIDILLEKIKELERDLIHDPLTGLKTRAFFEDELGVYLSVLAQNEQGKRKEWFGFRNLSIIFFDIDHFKKVNDTLGHDAGDEVLKSVAEIIRSSLRAGDTAARWGGEEMVVSLLGASSEDAKAKAEEIREKVKTAGVTISAGISSSEKGITLTELIKRADEALYRAKDTGRDKTVIY